MKKLVLKLFGIFPLMFFGDTAVFDRWIWLRKNLKKGSNRILDAGCGSGAFAMYAEKKGNEVIGISFDERNNRVAEDRSRILNLKNISFITGDLRKLDEMFSTLGTFDQIICFETIEHILGDEKLIRDFYSLLKPNGELLLTAPYEFYRRLPGDNISQVENGGHVRWGYTHERIHKLFINSGIRIEKVRYLTGIISQFLIRTERFLGKVFSHKIAWVIIFPFRFLVIFDFLLTKLSKYPPLSIAVVGVRQ